MQKSIRSCRAARCCSILALQSLTDSQVGSGLSLRSSTSQENATPRKALSRLLSHSAVYTDCLARVLISSFAFKTADMRNRGSARCEYKHKCYCWC